MYVVLGMLLCCHTHYCGLADAACWQERSGQVSPRPLSQTEAPVTVTSGLLLRDQSKSCDLLPLGLGVPLRFG